MAIGLLVRSAMQREMESELMVANVNIPGVDRGMFTEALARGICKGLERWERELNERWERRLDDKIRRRS
jgi:hypothetical protein